MAVELILFVLISAFPAVVSGYVAYQMYLVAREAFERGNEAAGSYIMNAAVLAAGGVLVDTFWVVALVAGSLIEVSSRLFVTVLVFAWVFVRSLPLLAVWRIWRNVVNGQTLRQVYGKYVVGGVVLGSALLVAAGVWGVLALSNAPRVVPPASFTYGAEVFETREESYAPGDEVVVTLFGRVTHGEADYVTRVVGYVYCDGFQAQVVDETVPWDGAAGGEEEVVWQRDVRFVLPEETPRGECTYVHASYPVSGASARVVAVQAPLYVE